MKGDRATVVLVAESSGFPQEAVDVLDRFSEVRLADLGRPGLIASIADVDVLWVRLRHRIDDEVLASGRRLRVLASPTTGLNHIDLESAERRGIEIISLRGESEFLQGIRATAEHTIGLLLALVRGLPEAAAHVLGGGWNRELFCGRELHGRTAGVVGHGRLGRLVSAYLAAFGCDVLTTDPAVAADDVEPGSRWVELAELLERAEIVTLHVDLRPDTRGFFDASCFAAMRPGAFFVNTSRGELIDEAALLESLSSGHLAGAALDVLSGESSAGMRSHPLVEWARGNSTLLITPHIGGYTKDSLERVEVFLARKVARWMEKTTLGLSGPRRTTVPGDE